jgi:hypothetical protein
MLTDLVRDTAAFFHYSFLSQLFLLAYHAKGQKDQDQAGKHNGNRKKEDLLSVTAPFHCEVETRSKRIF